MMNERIREIANQCSDFAEQIPYFRGIENGLTWEATIMKARDLKFAELMVKKFDDILVLEYLDCVGNKDKQAAERIQRLQEKVKTYFGVEE